MNEMINEVANEAAAEVAKEAAKKVDFMQAGVVGLCIVGGVSLVAGIAVGGKKLYNKFFKKDAYLDESEDDFDDDLTDEDIVLEEEETDKKKK